MSRYSEKLFRLQYGYQELKGDEIRAPYLEHHYRKADCISDLSLAERTAWYAREHLQNKLEEDYTPEQINDNINKVVSQALIEYHKNITCDHDYHITGWNHDKENMHWWNTWFGLKPKYIVKLECSICGKKEVHGNLTFKEFCDIIIPINLKDKLWKIKL